MKAAKFFLVSVFALLFFVGCEETLEPINNNEKNVYYLSGSNNPYDWVGEMHNEGMDSLLSEGCFEIISELDTAYNLLSGRIKKSTYDQHIRSSIVNFAIFKGLNLNQVNDAFDRLDIILSDAQVFKEINDIEVVDTIYKYSSSIFLSAYNRGYIDSLNYYFMKDFFDEITSKNFIIADSLINQLDIALLDSVDYESSLKMIAIYNASKSYIENYLNQSSCNSNQSLISPNKKPIKNKSNEVQTNWTAEIGIAIGAADAIGAVAGAGIASVVTSVAASGVTTIMIGIGEGWFEPETGHCCCGPNCPCE